LRKTASSNIISNYNRKTKVRKGTSSSNHRTNEKKRKEKKRKFIKLVAPIPHLNFKAFLKSHRNEEPCESYSASIHKCKASSHTNWSKNHNTSFDSVKMKTNRILSMG